MSFNLELTASDTISLTRGPYLQIGTPTSTVVRWRTSAGSESRVHYGSDWRTSLPSPTTVSLPRAR